MTTREAFDTIDREEGIRLFNLQKTEKELYDIFVAEKGLTDSFDTFKAEAEKIFIERTSKMSKEDILKAIEGAELTDAQLEQVAGGNKEEDGEMDDLEIAAVASAGTAVVAFAIAIACFV